MSNFFAQFNWLDWVIIFIFAFFLLLGFVRGFIREVYSLLVFVIAAVFIYFFNHPVANNFLTFIHSEKVALIVSSISILIIVWIIGRLLGFLVLGLKNDEINFVSRLLGAILSLLKAFVVFMIVVYLMNISQNVDNSSAWQNSKLAQLIVHITYWVQGESYELPEHHHPDNEN